MVKALLSHFTDDSGANRAACPVVMQSDLLGSGTHFSFSPPILFEPYEFKTLFDKC